MKDIGKPYTEKLYAQFYEEEPASSALYSTFFYTNYRYQFHDSDGACLIWNRDGTMDKSIEITMTDKKILQCPSLQKLRGQILIYI